ncbi:MAG: glycosyltransferase family 4 protein [Kiritimatiellaeota bacterium]|nr:glycosyltransferase family 4 protein [Kiritimatiellota bacterium]
MKTLFVETVSEMGGAQQSLLELCTTLPSFNVEAAAAVPLGPLHDALRAAGVRVYATPHIRARRRGLGLFATLFKLSAAPWPIAKAIRDFAPHIVHANTTAATLAIRRVPRNTLLFSHIRDLRVPRLALQSVFKRSTRVIAISTALDNYLSTVVPQSELGRIRTIRNGIDTTRFTPGDKPAARQRFALPPDAPLIGMVAHISPWKAHDTFIAAAAKIRAARPDAHFVIAGRDLFGDQADWLRGLRAQAADAGLRTALHWVSDLDRTEALLPALDALVHPARREPFGRSVCEAMAARVPVVAAHSGGILDIITHGVNGIFVPEDDPGAIAQSVARLLDDPAYAAKLAEAGRQHILQHFTKERLAQQLAHEYAHAIAAEAHGKDSDTDE